MCPLPSGELGRRSSVYIVAALQLKRINIGLMDFRSPSMCFGSVYTGSQGATKCPCARICFVGNGEQY